MDLIVGIDPSARKIAWVGRVPLLNVSRVEAKMLYKLGSQTTASMGDALAYVEEAIVGWAKEIAPSGDWYAWVEYPVSAANSKVSAIKQSFVGGIIRGALARAGFKVYDVNNNTWKKNVTGTNRGDKALTQQIVRRIWPQVADRVGTDSDLADAAAICIHGVRTLTASRVLGSAGLQ